MRPADSPSTGMWSSPRRILPAWSDHRLIVALFLRLLGLIYLAAFVSLGVQIEGLIGQAGILPLTDYLEHARMALGVSAYGRLPTLFWLDASDASLHLACWTGALAALTVVLGRMTFPALGVCYALYLSLTVAGQVFTSFQWDLLLLESGFLGLFLATRSPVVILLFRFLIFRFMLMGGIVKLASGDPTWRNLSTLNYHFETQPLPSPLAWYVHHLPPNLLAAFTATVLIIELAVPFLVWLPRPWRLFAAWSFILLQGSILLTGNFAFFNLLALALCLFLFEDRDLGRLSGRGVLRQSPNTDGPPSRLGQAGAGLMAAVVLFTCGTLAGLGQKPGAVPKILYPFARTVTDFGLVNGYGPFAVMTTERREILVEGSRDGVNWSAYGFRYKPDASDQPLGWNIPHQPRLDWQCWFAAL
ncbi:MAG: lipase maturation factor family protein, partial [Methylococcus sp.]